MKESNKKRFSHVNQIVEVGRRSGGNKSEHPQLTDEKRLLRSFLHMSVRKKRAATHMMMLAIDSM